MAAEPEMVVFEPSGRRVPADARASLLELARRAGVALASTCGGKGQCGKCRVQVSSGRALGPAAEDGLHLACQTRLDGGGVVTVPAASQLQQHQILATGHQTALELDPALRLHRLQVPPPDLAAVRADQERLLAELRRAEPEAAAEIDFPLPLLAALPSALAAEEGRVSLALSQGQRVRGLAPGWGSRCLGLAVDLGTTTVVAYLLDLESGQLLAVQAQMNPQVSWGEDVISRIGFCQGQPGGLALLQGQAVAGINQLAQACCAQAGADPVQIYECVLVGNTAMHHILLGLDPGGLARAPYAPVASQAQEVRAADLGLTLAPEASLYALPIKAGFVGADAVAAALAVGAQDADQPTLLLDLGTNGELVLAAPERLLCCSTAAGPAFEGGHISCGMRGAAGAVERVRLDPATLEPELSVIGGGPPLGLCGSGLVSAVAGLLAAGVLTPRGAFADDRRSPRLRQGAQGREFLLAPAGQAGGQDLVLTAKDVSELQLAKAAIQAGVSIMLAEMGLERVERVLLAGAFGNYLQPADAVRLGLLPGAQEAAIQGVGNAAGAGALKALASLGQRRLAEDIAQGMDYLELSAHPHFQDYFVESLSFPEPAV
ncbi:MAG: ASKHA domain-containing protein [Thermodesulfobacteriota bacterium]